jgi:hypothetical protein
MLAFELLAWWYGQGWRDAARNIPRMLTSTSHAFSTPTLLRTLFAPWRRIVTYPGSSLDTKVRAFGDNIVSRAVGFAVRLIVLITAFLMIAIVLVIGVLSVVLWPLVPLGVIPLLVLGIVK